MGKVSKNAKTNRGQNQTGKNIVKVIKAVKSKKTGSYSFKEGFINKDDVKKFLEESNA